MQPNKDNVDPEIINLAETADKKDLELSKAEADPAPEVVNQTITTGYQIGQLEKTQSTPTLSRGNSRRSPPKLLNRRRLRKSYKEIIKTPLAKDAIRTARLRHKNAFEDNQRKIGYKK